MFHMLRQVEHCTTGSAYWLHPWLSYGAYSARLGLVLLISLVMSDGDGFGEF